MASSPDHQRDKVSTRQLAGRGFFFSKPTEQKSIQKQEQKNLEEALTGFANYARSQSNLIPSCMLESTSLSQNERNRIVSDLKLAGIEVVATPNSNNNNVIKLAATKTSFGLEAKLLKPGEISKPFILAEGFYSDGILQLVRQIHGFDQRKEEVREIIKGFQSNRLNR